MRRLLNYETLRINNRVINMSRPKADSQGLPTPDTDWTEIARYKVPNASGEQF